MESRRSGAKHSAQWTQTGIVFIQRSPMKLAPFFVHNFSPRSLPGPNFRENVPQPMTHLLGPSVSSQTDDNVSAFARIGVSSCDHHESYSEICDQNFSQTPSIVLFRLYMARSDYVVSAGAIFVLTYRFFFF